jgi:glycosyltransferase involved in cell wall biosynthesis
VNLTLVCQGFSEASLRLQPWRRIHEISTRLVNKGVQITIITDPYESEQETEIDGIKIRQIEGLTLAPFLHPKQLVTNIQKTYPDAVVWYGSTFSPLYLNQLRSLAKPLIWDIDTDICTPKQLLQYPKAELLNPKNSMLQFILSTALSQHLIESTANSATINKIIVPNQHLKTVLTKKGVKPKKIAIIPSTIDKPASEPITEEKSAIKQKIGLAPTDFIVSYFGAPQIIRGPDIAILSMKKLLAKNPNAKLLVFSRRKVGGTSAEDEYHRQKEHYLHMLQEKVDGNGRVRIVSGFLDKQTVQQYVQASDVVVLPFRRVPSEPPLSVFESMAAGKAVVTSDLGGLAEIVGKDRGLVVPPADPDYLGEALLFLSQNPAYVQRLGENARRYADALPSWDEIADQFLDTIKTCI